MLSGILRDVGVNGVVGCGMRVDSGFPNESLGCSGKVCVGYDGEKEIRCFVI